MCASWSEETAGALWSDTDLIWQALQYFVFVILSIKSCWNCSCTWMYSCIMLSVLNICYKSNLCYCNQLPHYAVVFSYLIGQHREMVLCSFNLKYIWFSKKFDEIVSIVCLLANEGSTARFFWRFLHMRLNTFFLRFLCIS